MGTSSINQRWLLLGCALLAGGCVSSAPDAPEASGAQLEALRVRALERLFTDGTEFHFARVVPGERLAFAIPAGRVEVELVGARGRFESLLPPSDLRLTASDLVAAETRAGEGPLVTFPVAQAAAYLLDATPETSSDTRSVVVYAEPTLGGELVQLALRFHVALDAAHDRDGDDIAEAVVPLVSPSASSPPAAPPPRKPPPSGCSGPGGWGTCAGSCPDPAKPNCASLEGVCGCRAGVIG